MQKNVEREEDRDNKFLVIAVEGLVDKSCRVKQLVLRFQQHNIHIWGFILERCEPDPIDCP